MSTMLTKRLQLANTTAEARFTVDYNICAHAVGKTITLPDFAAPQDDNLSWNMEMKIGSGDVFNSRLDMKIAFKSKAGKRHIYARVDLTVTQLKPPSNTTKALRMNGSYRSLEVGTTHLGSLYFNRSPGNELYIEVQVDMPDVNSEWLRPPMSAEERPYAETPLSRSLGALLESGLLGDVVLCGKGGEVTAHRCILAARSDYFKAMFQSECKESSCGKVVISDIELPVLKQMLRYLYTGVFEDKKDDCSLPLQLLVAANKYQILDLCEECERRVLATLESSLSRLVEVLSIGYLLDCEPLRRLGLQVLEQHQKEVVRSQQWLDLVRDNCKFALQLLTDALSR